jgi:ATP-dependent Clp protease ATP-binding subunit ClpC
MFERFTANARRAVVMAQEEARRLNHNYIGTEHILLGLLRHEQAIAYQVLNGIGMTLEGARQEVTDITGTGKKAPSGHIPFTPRAKKILELALREALALHHNYIGTEHILLGLIREGDGVAAQILRSHGDLLAIRATVLDRVPAGDAEGKGALAVAASTALRHLRDRFTGGSEAEEEYPVNATPAANATLVEAARLAGPAPVGSHHLLLAALADHDSAARRAFVHLGVDLDQVREALLTTDITGTSDEPPEQAGRRQMVIEVTDELLTVVVADPVLVAAGKAALSAVNASANAAAAVSGEDEAKPGGDEAVSGEDEEADGEGSETTATATAIRGDNPAAASLADVWLELRKSLTKIADTTPPSVAA